MGLSISSQEMPGDLWGRMASGSCSRRLPLVVSGRGGRAVRTSGRECVAPGRGSGVGGRAVRTGPGGEMSLVSIPSLSSRATHWHRRAFA